MNLTPRAKRQKAEEKARAAYEKGLKPLEAAFLKGRKPLNAAYEKGREPLDAAYEKAMADAAKLDQDGRAALLAALVEMRRRHDTKAVAANFNECGCDDCVAARAAIAQAEVTPWPATPQ